MHAIDNRINRSSRWFAQAPLVLQLLVPVLLLGFMYSICVLLVVCWSSLWLGLTSQKCSFSWLARLKRSESLLKGEDSLPETKLKAVEDSANRCVMHDDPTYAPSRRGFVYNTSCEALHTPRVSDDEGQQCASPILRFKGAKDICLAV